MKKWLKTIIILLVIGAVGAGIFFGLPLLREEAMARAAATAEARALDNTAEVRLDDLTVIVSANGSVRPVQSGVLVWQTSGVVDTVLADVGDVVQEGDLLAEIDSTTLSQSIINARTELANAQKALNDLLTSQTPAAQARLALVQAQTAYDDALDKRGSLNYQRVTSLTLDQLEAELLLAQNALEDAEKQYEQFADRPENDSVRLSFFSRLTTARRNEQRAQANYNFALAGPDEQEIEKVDAELLLAESRLADARREWERLQNGPAAEDIMVLEARIESAQAILKTAYVEATFDGTITDVSVMRGDSVNVGTVAFRIDNLEKLYVDAFVLEIDINQVSVGQAVAIELDGAPGRSYNGIVTQVAKVGQTVGSQVQFKVTVEILDADDAVRPGMTADVSIVTRELAQVLQVANQALFFEEERVYVVVVNPVLRTTREVEVVTGISANAYTVVLEGNLKEGDELLLNLPETNDFVRDQFNNAPGFLGG